MRRFALLYVLPLLGGCAAVMRPFVRSSAPRQGSPLVPTARLGKPTLPPPPSGLMAESVGSRMDAKSIRSGTIEQKIFVVVKNATTIEFEAVEIEMTTRSVGTPHRERAILTGGFSDPLHVHTGRLLPGQMAVSRPVVGRAPVDHWRHGRTESVRVVGAKPVAKEFDPDDAESVWSFIRRARAPEFAAKLKAHPAMIRVRTKGGITPTLMACAQHDPGLVDAALAAGGSLSEQTPSGFGALHFVAMTGNAAVLKRVLKAGLPVAARAKDGVTPLHAAVWNRNAEVARALVKAGAPLEAKDVHQRTPLICVPATGDLAMAQALIGLGANPRAVGHEGDTFLAQSAMYGLTGFVELALSKGLKIDERDPKRGITALHMAAKVGHVAMVEWLLDHGADRDLKSSNGNTPEGLFRKYNANATDRRMMARAFAAH